MMYSELEKSESSNHCTKRRARKSQLGEFLRQEEKRKDSSYIVSSQTDNTLLHDSTVAAVVVLLACIPALGVSVPGAVAALQHGLTNANTKTKGHLFVFFFSEKISRFKVTHPVGGVVLLNRREAKEGVSWVRDDDVGGAVDLQDVDGGVELVKLILAGGLDDDTSRSAARGSEDVRGVANQALGHEAAVGVAGGEHLAGVNAGEFGNFSDKSPGEAKVVNIAEAGGNTARPGVEGITKTRGVGHNEVCVWEQQRESTKEQKQTGVK